MEIDNTWEQIGQQSKKILFRYDLQTNKFDMLTPAIRQVWKRNQEELEQQPGLLLELVHEDDRETVLQNIQKLKEGVAVTETVRLELEGKLRYISVDAYPLRDDSGTVEAIGGIAEDSTVQKQVEIYLGEFGRRKNSMLEIVSHDLRGPLAVVKSVANLLQHDLNEKKYEDIENYTRFIADACDTCTKLINDLLKEEHLRSPDVYVKKERVDVADEIRKVVESYVQSGIITQTFELDLPEKPLIMQVDPVKFSQILNNLISNSIKFTHPAGHIRIALRREGDEVLLVHQDDGVGIPEHLLPYIFDRYSGASRSGLMGEESIGIGLSIVRDLVELQGGRIWVESQENGGTTFYIAQPV